MTIRRIAKRAFGAAATTSLLLCGTNLLAQGHEHHASPGATPIPGPETFVSRALKNDPMLDAIQRQQEAIEARAEASSYWMDPMFNVGLQNVPYDPIALNATPMSGIRIGLSQQFPWPGKLALAEERLSHKAAARGADRKERQNMLAAATRRVYYDIHFTDMSLSVMAHNIEILSQFIEIAESNYRVGKGMQQHVLKAGVAKAQLEERVLELEGHRKGLVIRMHELTAANTPEAIPPLLAVPVTEFEAAHRVETLILLAMDKRPQFQSIDREIASADAAARFEDKAWLPDFTVGAGYTFKLDVPGKDPVAGADFLGVSVGFNVPVFSSQKSSQLSHAAVQEGTAQARMKDMLQLQVRRTIEDALTQIPRLEAQMAVYRDNIIPKTRQSLDADRTAYQVGKADFLDLLDTERRLINFEVDFHRLHVLREKMIVDLSEAVGVSPQEISKHSMQAEVKK